MIALIQPEGLIGGGGYRIYSVINKQIRFSLYFFIQNI